MARERYDLDGYSFPSKEEYERASKEKETIHYLMANTNTNDAKALLKVYNRSVEKGSFRTVIGLEYLQNLRRRLVESGIAGADALAPIPVSNPSTAERTRENFSAEQAEARVKRYQEAYEAARAGRIMKNLVIALLVVVIIAMLAITYKSQYSVFTYFTDYKENMRNELIDEYEQWQTELEQKEQDLQQREEQLQNAKK